MTKANHDQLLEEGFQLLGRTVVRTDPGRLVTWAGLGLTMTQLRVLFLLRANSGMTAGALAEELSVAPPTLTRIMDRLVRQSLVRRDVDRQDRRCVRHGLSAKGEATVGELERTGRAAVLDALRRLSPEQLERVVLALRDLLAAIETSQRARVEA